VRTEGWERLLAEHIEAARHTPFRWGTHDCALWCADWVRQATGQDFGGTWRGTYSTGAGAARAMKRQGFAGPADVADAHLTRRPTARARRGDLLLNSDGGLGVCHGTHGHFLTETGVTRYPVSLCTAAWGVG
jgi:hypothetical protein